MSVHCRTPVSSLQRGLLNLDIAESVHMGKLASIRLSFSVIPNVHGQRFNLVSREMIGFSIVYRYIILLVFMSLCGSAGGCQGFQSVSESADEV